MKQKSLIILSLFFFTILANCKKENNETKTLLVTPTSKTVTSDAGSFEVSISSNTNWTIEIDQNWCFVSTKLGNGNLTITISYDKTNVSVSRISNINFLTDNGKSSKIILTQEGRTIANSPNFISSTVNPFGINLSNMYNIIPTFVDIDNDLDLFVGDYNQQIFYYKNTGSKTNPSFAAKQQNPFGLATVGIYNLAPTFVDIDGDGDLDLFVGDYNQQIFYYKNIGSKSNPSFAAKQPNPFSLVTTGIYNLTPTFVDIDGDGDFDLFLGDYNQQIFYYKNMNF